MRAASPPLPATPALPALEAASARRGANRLVVARRAAVPLVQVRALLPGTGGATCRLAAATLLRRPGVQDALAAAGATAETTARPDGLLLSACGEPGETERLVALLLGVLRPAGPPPTEVLASEAARLSSADAVAARDPAHVVRRAALARAFGARSPLAEPAEDLEQVDPTGVQQWHDASGGITVVLCGDVDPGADWGDGPGDPPAATSGDSEPACTAPRWLVQHRPGSEQTTLRAVARVAAPGAPARAAAAVLQRLLGGGKGSRLVHELREQRGYGYHPGASLVDLTQVSCLLLEADVATDVTADAVRVVDRVLESMVAEPPEGEELERGRRGVVGDLARAQDAQGTLADLLLAGALAGAGPEWPAELAARVLRVDPTAVQTAAAGLLADLTGAASADLVAVGEQHLPATWSTGT